MGSIGLGELFADDPAASVGQAAALIAQLDVDAPPAETILQSLETMGSDAPSVDSVGDLMTYVFGHLGFRGNTENYYDQANSFLHRVIETRAGIPISLGVVAIEIGRRLGVELDPVGMPAHFLLGHGSDEDRRWFDPMSGGRSLTLDGVESLFSSLVPDTPFERRFLDPITSVDVATRMLNNLRAIMFRRGDLRGLSDVVAAQVELPNAPTATRLEYAQLFASRGHFGAAVDQLELLTTLDPERSDRYTAAADRIRANFN